MKKYLSDLILRKDLIVYLVLSGLKAQHRNSFLGYLWWLLDPLLNVAIYYFIVVIIFKKDGGPNFGLYMAIGMIVWRWLNSTVTSTAKSIFNQGGLISQIYLPKVIFPIGSIFTQAINFGFGLVVIAIFCVMFDVMPGWAIVWLPFTSVMQLCFMVALVLPIAFVCVFVRDVENIINHLVRLWFFGSPVIWNRGMISARWQWLLDINPMTHFMDGVRNIFIYNSPPDYMKMLYIGSFSLIFIAVWVYLYFLYEYKIIKAL